MNVIETEKLDYRKRLKRYSKIFPSTIAFSMCRLASMQLRTLQSAFLFL